MSKRQSKQTNLDHWIKKAKKDRKIFKVTLIPQLCDVIRGNSQTITCTIDGTSGEIDIKWRRQIDGSEVDIGIGANHQKYTGGTVDTLSLTINNFDYTDTGSYFCKVFNKSVEISSQESVVTCIASISIDMQTRGKILVDYGSQLRLQASITCLTSEQILVNWQKIKDNIPKYICINTDKYGSSDLDIKSPLLVIHDADDNDNGIYRLEVSSGIETVYGEEVLVEVFSDLSNEENNFIRFFLLCQKIATQAVRVYFNKNIPPKTLTNHLNCNRYGLTSGVNIPRCTTEQLNQLYPGPLRTAQSSEFDFTLLYKLIRNTMNVAPPSKGWGQTPDSCDITPEDDVERIRFYRNILSHNTKFIISDSKYKTWWKDISEAIDRLSSGSLKGEVNDLKERSYDKELKWRLLLDIRKSLVEMNDEIITMKKQHILDNVKEQHLKEIETWKKEDEVFYEEINGHKQVLSMLKTKPNVTIIGAPGSGKTALARHVALGFSREGYEIVPIKSANDLQNFASFEKKQVFILDDVFGTLSFDLSKFEDIKKITIYSDNGSKLICTCRKQIYNETSTCSGLTCEVLENMVDLQTDENKLTEKDQFNILAKHCSHNCVDKTKYESLKFPSTAIMFPLLCKLFSMETKHQKLAEEFFKKPIDCLLDELKNLRDVKTTRLSYAALVLLSIIKSYELSEEIRRFEFDALKKEVFNKVGINLGTTDTEMKEALWHMHGTYVTKIEQKRLQKTDINNEYYENDVCDLEKSLEYEYNFLHDVIFEVVAFQYGQRYPECIIQYMSTGYVADKVILYKGSIQQDLCIVLDKKQYKKLSERLYEDIQGPQRYHVFTNKVLSHPEFVEIFFQQIKSRPFKEFEELFLSYRISASKRGLPQKHISLYFYAQSLLVYLDEWECLERLIWWVVYCGHSPLLELIVNHVKDNGETTDLVFGKGKGDQTDMLILGCYSGCYELVKIILQYASLIDLTKIKPKYNCYLRGYQIPLTAACASGNLDIVELLLRKGASVNERDYESLLPLVRASMWGHLDIVKHLIEQCDKLQDENDNKWALCAAAVNGHEDIFNYLLNHWKTDMDKEILNQSLIFASQEGNYYFVTYIVRNFLNDIIEDDTLQKSVLIACFSGHDNIVKCLVEKECSMTRFTEEYGGSCLHEASQGGHLNIVKYLVEKGVNLNYQNKKKESALYVASKNGFNNIVKFLVEKGADIDLWDKNEKTPLYTASAKGHSEIVRLLLCHGADCTILNSAKIAPLQIAFVFRKTDIVKELVRAENRRGQFEGNKRLFETLLLIKQLPVYLKDYYPKIPIMLYMPGCDWVLLLQQLKPLCAYVWEEIRCDDKKLRYFIQIGLDVNAYISDRETLLSRLLMEDIWSYDDKLELLIEAGVADIDKRDSKQRSILEKIRRLTFIKDYDYYDDYEINYKYLNTFQVLKKHTRRYSF